MSDDEYVYDSPYEDVYDILYDADPAPELADDLAERAVYSPIWQHTHTGELKEYHSDWDDHSDDYWDDDPKLLNGNETNGKASEPIQPGVAKPAKRGRKRKLSEARERSTAVEESIEILQATLRGTVWKSKSPELDNAYKKGSEKPTALRLNDSIMHSAYNKTQGFGRGRLKRDESWANDLSLADMGLTTQTTSLSQPDVPADEVEDEYEEDLADSDLRSDGLNTVEEVMVERGPKIPKSNPTIPQDGPLEATTGAGVHLDADDSVEEQTSRKRRKVAATLDQRSKKAIPKPADSVPSVPLEAMPKSRKKVREQSEEATIEASSQGTLTHEDHEEKLTNGRRSRKRKLSPDSTATGSTASSRAKRAATDSTQSKSAPKDRQTGRTTRSRKA